MTLPERYSLINLDRKLIERANSEVTRFCRATYPSPHGDVADVCIKEVTNLNNELLGLIPK